jgi:hypothetical protein
MLFRQALHSRYSYKYRFPNLYDTISFDMSCFHCAVWCSDRCIVFSKLLK